MVGIGAIIAVGVAFVGLSIFAGVQAAVKAMTETEVVIIEPPPVEDEEPPPPPPVDVELPPPPPQVVIPEFTFDVPPPPNAIQQVVAVERPVNPPPRPAPPPAPKVTVSEYPSTGRRFTKPDYPSASRRAQEEGETTVSMCVASNGRVTDIKVVRSSGFSRLDEATVKGIERQRFQPAKGSDGKAMDFCGYELTMVWDLEEAR
ncbi:MAG: energy transducer TonB [Hyphomonadaceae bacterium]